MIKLVLVLILVWTIGWTVSAFRQSSSVLGPSTVMALDHQAQTPADAEPVQIRPLARGFNSEAILRHNLFGDTDTPPAGPGPADVNTPATPLSIGEALGIALTGTVSGSPRVARAVILDRRTKAVTVYKIGDRVADAAIEEISKDAVVFSRGGSREVLRHAMGKAPSSPVAQPPGEPSPTPAVVGQTASTPSRTDTVQQLLDKAVICPYLVDGQMHGLQISGLDQIPGAKRLGLADGDVISAVNGQPLTNPRKAFQLFKKARSQQTLEIGLLRKGRAETLSFDLR